MAGKNYNQQVGIVKRQARAKAKQLVKDYVENGIYENYGSREIRELASKVPHQIGYRQQQEVIEQIRDLIGGTADILFSHGRGNTRNVDTRKQLAYQAMRYVQDFEWN